jgi:hypothetical protein
MLGSVSQAGTSNAIFGSPGGLAELALEAVNSLQGRTSELVGRRSLTLTCPTLRMEYLLNLRAKDGNTKPTA